MEIIIGAIMVVTTMYAGTAAIGPNQLAAPCEQVAVVSERTGDVLYYNCK